MQAKLVHAILSGIMIALVLGFVLIPAAWQVITGYYEEPTFGSTISGRVIMEIFVSCAIMAITLFSFKLVRRVAE